MNIHEYQAKEILQSYGVPIPPFAVASKAHDAEKIVKQLNLKEAVIKIQVHAGGRGKAGGVKFAKSPQEILSVASHLIGMKLVNNQTGKEGVIAHKVLISADGDQTRVLSWRCCRPQSSSSYFDRLS
jgi:succinyl-CoA synthetase beta subunit